MEKEKFNAYRYADEFEKLSLEIISIMYLEESEPNVPVLEKIHTQKTRDHGVDGYIRFCINNSVVTYTVEAKLRTCKTLGLQDFANSILYSLINFSTRHFVVTNITYSKEALSVIDELNVKQKGNIDLIDGKKLQGIINQKSSIIAQYSKQLIKYILDRDFKEARYSRPAIAEKEAIPSFPLFTKRCEDMQKHILKQSENGQCFFIIEGAADTGKTTFIEATTEMLAQTHKKQVHIFDMETLTTPRLFLLRIIEIVSGVNILSLLENISNDDTEDLLEAASDEFNSLQDLGVAIKILFNSHLVDEREHIFYLDKFLKKAVCEKYLTDANIIYFKNIEKLTLKQMRYLTKNIQVFPQNGIIVFLELLIPFYEKQLAYVSLEKWADVCTIFKSIRYKMQHASVVTLGNYLFEEKVYLINKSLKRKLPLSYLQTLERALGDTPGNFHFGLDYVNRNKLYTVSLLKNSSSKLHSSLLLFRAIWEDYKENCDRIELISEAIILAYLFEDYISEGILTVLSKRYDCDARLEILKCPFFEKACEKIKIVDIHIYEIENLITPARTRSTAEYALPIIDKLYKSEYDKAYFKCLLNIYAHDELNKHLIAVCIKHLKKRCAISRIEKLLYTIYNSLKDKNYGIKEKLELIIYYIKFINNQYLYSTQKVNAFLLEAEILYNELDYSDGEINVAERVQLQIGYSEAMYYRQKMLYDYNKCQQSVNDILKYENVWLSYQQQYVNAHMWQALIYKEHGDYKAEFKEYIKTIRKYPDNMDIKKAFLMNASAYYYFKSKKKALLFLERALDIVKQQGEDYKQNLWLYHDWLMVKMLNQQYDIEFLCQMREYAERCSASNVLARSFNMEGYYYLTHYDYKKAFECFQTAVSINEFAGKNKAYFLFLANLITIKVRLGLCIEQELEEIDKWVVLHSEIIYERLSRTSKKSTEHMFAALASCMNAASKVRGIGEIVVEHINKKCFDFSTMPNLIECIDDSYIIGNDIIILF